MPVCGQSCVIPRMQKLRACFSSVCEGVEAQPTVQYVPCRVRRSPTSFSSAIITLLSNSVRITISAKNHDLCGHNSWSRNFPGNKHTRLFPCTLRSPPDTRILGNYHWWSDLRSTTSTALSLPVHHIRISFGISLNWHELSRDWSLWSHKV